MGIARVRPGYGAGGPDHDGPDAPIRPFCDRADAGGSRPTHSWCWCSDCSRFWVAVPVTRVAGWPTELLGKDLAAVWVSRVRLEFHLDDRTDRDRLPPGPSRRLRPGACGVDRTGGAGGLTVHGIIANVVQSRFRSCTQGAPGLNDAGTDRLRDAGGVVGAVPAVRRTAILRISLDRLSSDHPFAGLGVSREKELRTRERLRGRDGSHRTGPPCVTDGVVLRVQRPGERLGVI